MEDAAAIPRVLVVDDDTAFADMLVFLLNSNGLSAKAAYSGREAIEPALKSLPDFVLMDVIMDGIDGCGCRDSDLRDYSNSLAGRLVPQHIELISAPHASAAAAIPSSRVD